MPNSLRARSSIASVPCLRSRTSASSKALRACACWLACCCDSTWRFRSQTFNQPPLPSHSGYCNSSNRITNINVTTRIKGTPDPDCPLEEKPFTLDLSKGRSWFGKALVLSEAEGSPRTAFFAHFRLMDNLGLSQLVVRLAPRIGGGITQVFFDAQQLVVFRHAVRARHRAGLDLHHVGGHREVGNEGILGLAGAVR